MSDMEILDGFLLKINGKEYKKRIARTYLSLYRYMLDNSTYDENKDMNYICISISELASMLNCSKGVLSADIVELEKLGVVERVKGTKIIEPYTIFMKL